jgi:acetyl esterase/lipase
LPLIRALRPVWRFAGIKDAEVVSLANGAAVRIHRPADDDQRGRALLWIHGGGYLIGDARQDDRMCQRFCERLGITVASVDYRLAPMHPYPAALEDCYAALSWLATQSTVDSARMAVGGASAGGGLAAALALLARDRGEIQPAFQLLAYPMLDDRTKAGREAAHYRMWNERSNRFAWSSYIGQADPAVAVPARRADLAGLPPAWIGVGTLDLFHDEAMVYASRLTHAGVGCDVEVVRGAFHAFDLTAPKAEVSRAFFERQCVSLDNALK